MEQELNRFIKAQESSYQQALSEIKSGRKRSHWMWYIFPQFKGLGFSETSKFYAIQSIEEARQYLKHPVLGNRLREITVALIGLEESNANKIMGSPDDLKLQSSMTLFSFIDESSDKLFCGVLDKFYQGEKDPNTLRLLAD